MKNNFQTNLVKGKIAETIFQQMWSDIGTHTILPLGYERVVPGLIDYHNSDSLKTIRSAPDFVLIPKDEKDKNIIIVEVKYRNHLDVYNIVEIAKEQYKRWNPSYLFVITLNGFYFDRCDKIIKKTFISKLSKKVASQNLQDKYLDMIKYFLKQ